ncbi:MAG: anhydro-N-acetylmuramic acid kinase [Planctomycetota bacterium]|nr:anhydro-N-acetylmuramic acid kinase [Planctomycetota bacterium]
MDSKRRAEKAYMDETTRWAIGLHVSYRCRRVEGVLIAANGRGREAWIDIKAAKALAVSDETAALFRQLSGTLTGAILHDALPELRSGLAKVEADLCGELLAQAALPDKRTLAVGVHDPGIWGDGTSSADSYLGLCDAALLAELTGMNVIDAFPARDLAGGGQGGPITALPEWILLQDPLRERLLLDLGRTIRMTYLPAGRKPDAPTRVLAFEVGPGTRLLDELTHRLTGGQHSFDRGGSMAVQGRRIDELLTHWLADPSFNRPLPRWHPRGMQPERFLSDAIRMAVDSDWTVRDLLCTAAHLIAESVVQALRWLPSDAQIDQMLLTGGGRHNGMLLREIDSRMPHLSTVHVQELGVPDGVLSAASIAVLVLCHVDQIAVAQASSGLETSRVLGRLTPGTTQNWQRLLYQMTEAVPISRPLRKAL